MKVKDLFWITVFGAGAIFAYNKYKSISAEPIALPAAARQIGAEPEVEDRSWIKQREDSPATATTSPSASCDGRTRCTQMNSCAEATFFIQNCPNTEMDGDHDGVPCEDQWCR